MIDPSTRFYPFNRIPNVTNVKVNPLDRRISYKSKKNYLKTWNNMLVCPVLRTEMWIYIESWNLTYRQMDNVLWLKNGFLCCCCCLKRLLGLSLPFISTANTICRYNNTNKHCMAASLLFILRRNLQRQIDGSIFFPLQLYLYVPNMWCMFFSNKLLMSLIDLSEKKNWYAVISPSVPILILIEVHRYQINIVWLRITCEGIMSF